MKIQMIGHSKAGKTTYMAAMYKVMTQGSGYQLNLHDQNERDQLATLGRKLKKGIYPTETDVKSEYNFDFYFENEPLFAFEWMDYRGGVLEGMQDDRKMLNEVARYANECESMIVFVDSTTMNSAKGLQQWNHLLQFILKFSGRASKVTPLSLTIILTKKDLSNWSDIRETLVGRKIMNTIDQINQNKDLDGMLVFSRINKDTVGTTFFSVLNAMHTPLLKSFEEEFTKVNSEINHYNTLNSYTARDIYNRILQRKKKLESLNLHIKNMRIILKEYEKELDYILF